MKRQSGFTLIELIIVIVILGILAVTAAPQFFNFGGDARSSVLRGLEGSVNGATDLVYSRSAIEGLERQGLTGAGNDDYRVNGDGIEVLYGYPAATATGLQSALNINVNDWDIAFDGDEGNASIRFSPANFNTLADESSPAFAEIADCSVTYTESTGPDSRPAVVVDSENC